MFRITTDYTQHPDILAPYFKKFRNHQAHNPKDMTDKEVVASLFEEPSWYIGTGFKKMMKGAALGGFIGGFYESILNVGMKDAALTRLGTNTRLIIVQYSSYLRRIKGHIGFGAVAGLSWFIIYDMILCPHGNVTFNRYMAAHSIAGGFLIAALYHPASYWIGMLGGAVYALTVPAMLKQFDNVHYPKNFHLYIKDFDEEKRKRELRDDMEADLSSRHVVNEFRRPFHAL